MHHFVTAMCTLVHASVTKWCIVGYVTGALWDLCSTFIPNWCMGGIDAQIRTVHYNNVIMGAIASQITSLKSVYSTVYSDADQIKHQSSASLAFVRGIHRGRVNSPHKWPVTRKMFPFDDVIMSAVFLGQCSCHDELRWNGNFVSLMKFSLVAALEILILTTTSAACCENFAKVTFPFLLYKGEVFHYDDVIKWKHFPRYWPFVRGIHRSPVNSSHKGRWRGALIFSLICVWINDWVNNREAGDLRRHRGHSRRHHNDGNPSWPWTYYEQIIMSRIPVMNSVSS